MCCDGHITTLLLRSPNINCKAILSHCCLKKVFISFDFSSKYIDTVSLVRVLLDGTFQCGQAINMNLLVAADDESAAADNRIMMRIE
jgi:hypothetical protein